MTFSEQKLRNYLEYFGYQKIEVPTLEPASLFLTKAGDQIIERLMTFEHQGSLLALRPEFTASAAYRYLSEQRHDVVRWQFSGPIFENRTQRQESQPTGHPYQRQSIGAELIGFQGTFADAEVAALAVLGLRDQGLHDFRLTLGHVGLTRHLLRQFELDDRALRFLLKQRADLYEEQITRDEVIAKLDRYLAMETRHPIETNAASNTSVTIATEMLSAVLSNSSRSQTLGGRSQQDIARRLMEKAQRAASRSQIIAGLDFLIEWMAIRAPLNSALKQITAYLRPDDTSAQMMLHDWLQMIAYLEQYGIDQTQIELEPDLVRSWDYYNGIVFEMQTTEGVFLAGGGRYDDLAQLLGAQNAIPAVGFVYEVDAVIATLGNRTDEAFKGTYISGTSEAVLAWSQALRQAGIIVSVLPDSSSGGEHTLRITDTSQAQYAGQTYWFTELDSLIAQLQKPENATGAW